MSLILRASRNISISRSNQVLSANSILSNEKLKRYSPSTTCTSVRHKTYTEFAAGIYAEISNSTLVHLCQQNLINIHDFTGLPWWTSIILTTVLFRTVITLPLTIYTNKIRARIEKITTELPAIHNELLKEVALAKKMYNLDESKTNYLYRRSMKTQWNKLVIRENCHPMKTIFVLWGQIPLWICQSVAIRNILNVWPDPSSVQAQIVLQEFSDGGAAWFHDLTAVDSTFILPITLGVLNLANIEFQTLQSIDEPTRFRRIVSNFFRLISLGMIPIAASVPSCLTLYWTTSSAYSLVQNIILVSPRVKRFIGIPTNTRSHLDNPYRFIIDKFSKTWNLKK